MFTKRNKQDTSGESDFDEFLKVLEDLEDQADHVAIDSSVTKRTKRPTKSHNHNTEDFYFDISGNFSNLKKSFLTNMPIPLSKNNSSENQVYDSFNSFSSTEINLGDQQKVKNVGKRVKRNKDIYIKYKYNDNYGTYSNLNNKSSGADRDEMLKLKQKAKPLILMGEKQYPSKNIKDIISPTFNVSTMNSKQFHGVETCPSICGSTDDDIIDNMVDFSEPTNTSIHLEQENYFKTPTKHKFETISRNNFLKNKSPTFIDIRDSDCEMTTFSSTKGEFKAEDVSNVKKTKKRKRTSSLSNTNLNSPFEEYLGEKRLKFVNIEDSDCQMSLYSKTKKKTKLKRRKSKDKGSISMDDVKNVSQSFTVGANMDNEENYKQSLEKNDCIRIQNEDKEFSLLTKNKKKDKTKTDLDRTSSPSNKSSNSPFQEYVGEKQLKFVNIENSDCEMSLYKIKKKRKYRDKQSISLDDIRNVSQSFTASEKKDKEENSRQSLERVSKSSLLTKIKKKHKSKTDIDSLNYDFWKKNLETRKSIFIQNGKNQSSNNIFLSVDQMNWDDHDDISEDTKKINFVDIRDSDCEIAILTKSKKRKKKKSKHRKGRIDITNDKIENTEIKTDSELVKQNEILNEKDNNKHATSIDSQFTNRTIENLINNETYYDFKFNNMEEIKKDFDTSGISFEEDLSIIEHNSSPTKSTIKKEGNIKTSPGNTQKFPYIFKLGQKPTQLKNVNMPDLDLTKLSVLVDLKSVKETSKNVSDPSKFFKSGNTENKVLIEVSYSDSCKYEQNWRIGIRNIEGNERTTVKNNLNINEDYTVDKNVNSDYKEKVQDACNVSKYNEVKDKIALFSGNAIKNESLAQIDQDDENCIGIINDLQTPNENVSTLMKTAEETKLNKEKYKEVKMPNSKCEIADPVEDMGCLQEIDSSVLDDVTNENDSFNQLDTEELLTSKTESLRQSSDENESFNQLETEDLFTSRTVSLRQSSDENESFNQLETEELLTSKTESLRQSSDENDYFNKLETEDLFTSRTVSLRQSSDENDSFNQLETEELLTSKTKSLRQSSDENDSFNQLETEDLFTSRTVSLRQSSDENDSFNQLETEELLTSKTVSLRHSSYENDSFNQLETEEFLTSKTESLRQSSDDNVISDLHHSKNVSSSEYDTDDTDDIFKDELKSKNTVEAIKYPEVFSNDGNAKVGRESHDNNTFEEIKNQDEDEKKIKETGVATVFASHIGSQVNQIVDSGDETPNLEVLKPVPPISVSSNFDDIILSDDNTILHNINLEELKRAFAEENLLENKLLIKSESTEDFVVSQPESDNESNLKSLLIFDDINGITLNSSSQQQDVISRSQSEDQIIMDLEVFMDVQNVQELFENTIEREEEEIDVLNSIRAVVSAGQLESQAATGIDSLISNMALEEISHPENKDHEELIPISVKEQLNSEDEAEELNDSDYSNYSDELKCPVKKRKYVGEMKQLMTLNTKSESRNFNQEKKDEDPPWKKSDDRNENKNLERFLKNIEHVSEDIDFLDESDGDYDLDAINDQMQKEAVQSSDSPAEVNSSDESHSDLKESCVDGPYRAVTEDDIENIRNLKLKLPTHQSALHQMVKRASVPTKIQYEDVRKAGITPITGVFSVEEDEIIKRNWENFLMEYNLDIPPTAMFKLPRKMKLDQKILFVKYLSQGLDNRWPHSVHERFKNIYLNKQWKTGRYTEKEDKIILDYLAETESTHPYKDLEKILNRPAYNIIQRFRYYRTDKKKITKWTLEELEKFVKNLMKITKCNNIEELRHRKFSIQEWQKLAKRMKNGMTAHHVKYAWKTSVHYRLFSDDVPLPIVKAELLKRLEDANVVEWKHINWQEIAKDFHGYNSTYLCLAFLQICKQIPPAKRKNFRECLSILRKRYPKETPSQKASIARKKLKWENGRLKYRDEISDNKS